MSALEHRADYLDTFPLWILVALWLVWPRKKYFIKDYPELALRRQMLYDLRRFMPQSEENKSVMFRFIIRVVQRYLTKEIQSVDMLTALGMVAIGRISK